VEDKKASGENQQGVGNDPDSAKNSSDVASESGPTGDASDVAAEPAQTRGASDVVSAPADPASGYVFGVPSAIDLATSAPVEPAKSDAEVGKIPAAPGAPLSPSSPSPSSPSPSSPSSSSSTSAPDSELEEDVPPPPTYADLHSKNLPTVTSGQRQSPSSQSTSGSAAPGNSVPGQAASGQAASGQAASGQPASGQPASAQSTSGQPSVPLVVQAGSGAGVPSVKADKFAVDEVITFGWKEMLKYFWPVTGVMTCNFFVQTVPAVTSMVLTYCVQQTAGIGLISGIMSLIGGVLGLIMSLGLFNVWLRIVDGDTVAVRDVYSKSRRTWNFSLAALLYGIMVVAGYICLIVPGVYLQLRFQFFSYFIVDSNAGPITSLKASWAISKGSLAELFFLGIVNYFISWVGMLCLLVGAYPAYIVQQIALAKTYRLLRKNTPLEEMPPNLMPLALISDTEPPLQPV
jgi:hypothetical protein